MNLHNKILTLFLAAAICLASACTTAPAATAAPVTLPTPGLSEADIRTQAVGTVLAALTASAPLPTDTATVTPQPTFTATLTPALTDITLYPPTRTLPVLAIPTRTFTPSQNDFSCEILSQDPGADIPTFEIDDPYDLVVTVKNTGDKTWYSPSPPTFTNGVIFMFINGKYMQEKGKTIIFVPNTEKHHDAKLVVDLKAPDAPGTYMANYAMLINHLFFCPVHFTIKVK